MAELSTIARPYAEALFATARTTAVGLEAWLAAVEELAALVAHPQVAELIANPKLSTDQVLDVVLGLTTVRLVAPADVEARNFLRMLVENNRLMTLPEIARQFRARKNEAEGVADCLIESAFALSDTQITELLTQLFKKFGLKLKPEVRVDAALIGGVRITVGDQVLDTSVKTRLSEMHAALVAA